MRLALPGYPAGTHPSTLPPVSAPWSAYFCLSFSLKDLHSHFAVSSFLSPIIGKWSWTNSQYLRLWSFFPFLKKKATEAFPQMKSYSKFQHVKRERKWLFFWLSGVEIQYPQLETEKICDGLFKPIFAFKLHNIQGKSRSFT